jgi:hypothetical protein
MLGGFNTNVPYKGVMYHVQTEDGGTRNPILITQLYCEGAILTTETSNYAELLIEDSWKEIVAKKMKDQHKRIIKDLLSGKYTAGAGEDQPHVEEDTERPLVEVLVDYILPPER